MRVSRFPTGESDPALPAFGVPPLGGSARSATGPHKCGTPNSAPALVGGGVKMCPLPAGEFSLFELRAQAHELLVSAAHGLGATPPFSDGAVAVVHGIQRDAGR